MVGACAAMRQVGPRKTQNAFFQTRTSANTATRSASLRPACSSAAARTAGSSTRRNGFVARSSAIVDGTVGSLRSRFACTPAWRCYNRALAGSTACAKRRFASVYSWPQKTRVSAGTAPSLDSESTLCAGVSSNGRPQPPVNSVSPQKTIRGGACSRSRRARGIRVRGMRAPARRRRDRRPRPPRLPAATRCSCRRMPRSG